LFPVDEETLKYLAFTGRKAEQLDLVERYTKEQGLFRSDRSPEPEYTDVLELDLATVEPSLAGPKRPQDRVLLSGARKAWLQVAKTLGSASGTVGKSRREEEGGPPVASAGAEGAGEGVSRAKGIPVVVSGRRDYLRHGSVVIAAITSCTNTSNPAVMLAEASWPRKR
jgi:aconitate hydratase